MSIDEVIASEGEDVEFYQLSETTYGIYDINIVDTLTATALFAFSKDGLLTSGFYIFNHSHETIPDLADDYDLVKGTLTEKYGTPFSLTNEEDMQTTRYIVDNANIVLMLIQNDEKVDFTLLYDDPFSTISANHDGL